MALQPPEADKVNGDGQLEMPNVGDEETPLGITIRQALNVVVDEITRRAHARIKEAVSKEIEDQELDDLDRRIRSEIEYYVDRYVYMPDEDSIRDTAYETATDVFDDRWSRHEVDMMDDIKSWIKSQTELPSLEDIRSVQRELTQVKGLAEYFSEAKNLGSVLNRCENIENIQRSHERRLCALADQIEKQHSDDVFIENRVIHAEIRADAAMDILGRIRDLLNGQTIAPLGGDENEATDSPTDEGQEPAA